MTTFISTLIIYILAGIPLGLAHMNDIYQRVMKVGIREQYLRDMVSMYELSPSGAEYYAELQDLHVASAEMVREYNELLKRGWKYQFSNFFLGFIIWPYYLITLNTIKRKRGKK